MLHIIQAGIQTTVQDLGRHHVRHFGISQCGALDTYALSVANLLAGNPKNTNGLEFTLGPIEIVFTQNTVIALSGCGFNGKIVRQSGHTEQCYTNWRIVVNTGDKLLLTNTHHGTRGYLAVNGGLRVADIFASGSTDLNNQFGGLEGRALTPGDKIDHPALAPALQTTAPRGIKSFAPETTSNTVLVRAIAGPEFDDFTPAAQQAFWNEAWSISSNSNRMGMQLLKQSLTNTQTKNLFSHAVFAGIIQVPASGQPIILLADAQTTGGYPRIASVIAADMHKVVQAGFNRKIQFVQTSIEQAVAASQQWAYYFDHLEKALQGA